jgi:DNA-binding transcriptional regulator YiaG
MCLSMQECEKILHSLISMLVSAEITILGTEKKKIFQRKYGISGNYVEEIRKKLNLGEDGFESYLFVAIAFVK